MKDLLCEKCRDKVAVAITRRGSLEKGHLEYKAAVSLRRKVDDLMLMLERKIF